MKGRVIFGLRVMRESTWTSTVLERVTLQHERDALRAELVKLVGQGAALDAEVSSLAGRHRKATDEVKAAIAKVLECNRQLATSNVHLAHRVEVAELQAEQARTEQAETERLRRRLTEVVDHVERFCDNPDTVAWVRQRSGLRQP